MCVCVFFVFVFFGGGGVGGGGEAGMKIRGVETTDNLKRQEEIIR